jgi:hypothetical protein
MSAKPPDFAALPLGKSAGSGGAGLDGVPTRIFLISISRTNRVEMATWAFASSFSPTLRLTAHAHHLKSRSD